MPENKSILESELWLSNPHSNTVGATLKRFASVTLDRFLLLRAIRDIYRELPPCQDAFEFVGNSLEILKIKYDSGQSHLDAIPDSGPAVVTANHPFGGIDGLILIDLLSKKRKDVMVMANYFLGNVRELKEIFFMVDPFGEKGSERKNISSLKQAVRWVKEGGMLVTFPAGEVSHLTLKTRKIEDSQWNRTLGRLIHMTKAPVLPIYFHGRNSIPFQVAGVVHPKLRTALLPMELLRKKRSTIKLKIGKVIPYHKMSTMDDPGNLMDYLRFRTYLLGKSIGSRQDMEGRGNSVGLPDMKKAPVIPAVDAGVLVDEISKLPPEQKLVQTGPLCVYYGMALQIPAVLIEIGRLREITFRGTGEGTGRAVDLDRFDQDYVHLFLWNEKEQEVVGAYRLGRTDKILPARGKKGLYTHTLFDYKQRLLSEMGPALEMGRSFVRKEYQKSFSALLLLWKGIGSYVAKNPRYRMLFGAVSITNDYHSYSRDLMVTFLKMNHFLPHLSGLVKPRSPYKPSFKGINTKTIHVGGNDVEEISSWISGIEEDGKGVPILLKQYLKLGGKLLCFNIDNDFEKVLDGLILVDLKETDSKVLSRYMGSEGLQRFYEYHFGKGGQTEQGIKRLPERKCA